MLSTGLAGRVLPYGRQSIGDDDVAAVVDVLRGDWLTQGPTVARFEDALCCVTEAKHAVAFSNGTAALHAALWAAGIGEGDRVVTSPLSFVASANCAAYVGAKAEFVDIDSATLNLRLDVVPADVDALVAVHYAGLPLDLARLPVRPRVVVEDAAHALGARTPSGPVGNCAHSDLCTFSFHPVKSITTGEGGAVTTNSDELATRLRRFRSHGVVPRPDAEGEGGWYYEVESLGFNYRITDLQCALGLAQLGKLGRFVVRRNELAARYRALLADVPGVVLPAAAPGTPGWRHAYHLFPVRVPQRRRVYDELRASGIGVQVHYVPIYRHPLYAREGWMRDQFPATEAAYAGLLSLPMHPGLTDDDQDRVVTTLQDTLTRNARL
jgi:UDP-4-amino-4,6-dideoxy-N-acetyl-beta-L-altrosamine transaminase